MDINQIITKLKKTLSRHGEIAFAYVHGSVLSSASPQDLDVAVFLYPDQYFDFLPKRKEYLREALT